MGSMSNAIPAESCRFLQLRTCPGCGGSASPGCWLPLAIQSKQRDGKVVIEAVVYPVCLRCYDRVEEEESMFAANWVTRDLYPHPERPKFRCGCETATADYQRRLQRVAAALRHHHENESVVDMEKLGELPIATRGFWTAHQRGNQRARQLGV